MTNRLPPGPRQPKALQTLGWWVRPVAYMEQCRARYGKRFTIRLLAAPPFWESKAPREWTDRELSNMLTDSPWARAAVAGGILPAAGVRTYLASALPMQEAEAESVRRGTGPERALRDGGSPAG